MPDEGSSINRTQVTVAVIGLASAVTVALIANSDKLFGHRDAAPTHASPPHEERSTPEEPSTDAPPPAAPPDIAGRWQDGDGYTYLFTQDGGAYSYRQRKGEVDQGGGVGTISGHTLRHRFTTAEDQGTCEGLLSADGRLISGTCTVGGQPWPFSIRRAS